MDLQFLLTWVEPPVLAIIILLEVIISAVSQYPAYTWKDSAVNFAMMFSQMLVDLLMRGISFTMLYFFYKMASFHIHTPWLYWTSLFVLADFAFYILHYIDHRCRLFWAVHVTHHSSEKYNLTVGFRSSVFQPLYRSFYFVPLALMGFEPLHILFAYAAMQFYGTFVHTEYVGKLGILEYIFVTPSHHRVHHASNPEYLDKNMGMFLIIWDRIFGTFQAELDEVKPEFGLTTKLESYNPFKVIFHEWVAIMNDIRRPIPFRYKLGYIFGLPGWSHDGSRKTSEQLREEKMRASLQPVEGLRFVAEEVEG